MLAEDRSPTVTVRLAVRGAAQMRLLGARLAGLLGPGDLVVLAGALGAGKTTLVQGIGDGLGVRGPVTSPTFVIARVHPSLRGGPDLVHADAYRLGSRLACPRTRRGPRTRQCPRTRRGPGSAASRSTARTMRSGR